MADSSQPAATQEDRRPSLSNLATSLATAVGSGIAGVGGGGSARNPAVADQRQHHQQDMMDMCSDIITSPSSARSEGGAGGDDAVFEVENESPPRQQQQRASSSSGSRRNSASAAKKEDGAASIVTTIAGKTIWTDVDDAASIHSVGSAASASASASTSGRSFGSGSKRGGGKNNKGRAASMLARTRNPTGEKRFIAKHRGSASSSVGGGAGSVSSASAAGRRTPRTRSFDSVEGDANNESILDQLKAERSAATSSGSNGQQQAEVIPEGSKEFSSQNLNVPLDSVRLDSATNRGGAAGGNNGESTNNVNASMNEVERARMALWGVAAKNQNEADASASSANPNDVLQQQQRPSPLSANAQAGQGTSEERDRSDREASSRHEDTAYMASSPPSIPQSQQQQGTNEYKPRINPLTVLFQRLQAAEQQAYTQATQAADVEAQQGQNSEPYLDREDSPDISSRFGASLPTSGQGHNAFFSEARADATSYVSDLCSLLLVLLMAPFHWIYFAFSGRDYHDRYGTSSSVGYDVAASQQSTFGSGAGNMTKEELQERAEVFLEAKEEDGTLFALLAFHHPGLAPLVDETMDAVQLTQVLGEDTAKTGDTDLAAALDPDRCVQLKDDDDDVSEPTDNRSVGTRSVGSFDIDDAMSGVDANRSGRSRESAGRGRSKRSSSRHRSRSTSVDARAQRRDRSGDEWVFDIKEQKMRRKRGGWKRRDSRDSQSFDSMSFDGMSFDDAVSARSGDPTKSISSEPPGVITATRERRGRRSSRRDSTDSSEQPRRRAKSAEGLKALQKLKSANKSDVIKKAAAEWNDRGKTTDDDRAAWKRNQMSVDMTDDLVSAAMAELEDIGSTYEARPEKKRPGGRKGLGMSSFRKVQEGLRKSSHSVFSNDGEQYDQKDVPDIV